MKAASPTPGAASCRDPRVWQKRLLSREDHPHPPAGGSLAPSPSSAACGCVHRRSGSRWVLTIPPLSCISPKSQHRRKHGWARPPPSRPTGGYAEAGSSSRVCEQV